MLVFCGQLGITFEIYVLVLGLEVLTLKNYKITIIIFPSVYIEGMQLQVRRDALENLVIKKYFQKSNQFSFN